jgi:hypothetical protein
MPDAFWHRVDAIDAVVLLVAAAVVWATACLIGWRLRTISDNYPRAVGSLENSHAVDDELAMVGEVVARADGVWLESESRTASGHTLKQRRRVA